MLVTSIAEEFIIFSPFAHFKDIFKIIMSITSQLGFTANYHRMYATFYLCLDLKWAKRQCRIIKFNN